MKKQKLQTGDMFSIKASSNEFVFGRILFDVKEYHQEKDIKPDNYFDWFSGCILIETYAKVATEFNESFMSSIAVKSSFIPTNTFDEDDWQLLGKNIPVKPEEVSFPEVLRVNVCDIYFCVGEVTIKTDLDLAIRDEIGVYPSYGSGYWEFIATLDFANRRDLIEDQDDVMETYFTDCDLRSHPEIRKDIYKRINENPEISYYELALKHGFDLGRFYNN